MKCADPNDPGCQNISKCMQMADFVVDNSGSKEKLYEQMEAILKEIENGKK